MGKYRIEDNIVDGNAGKVKGKFRFSDVVVNTAKTTELYHAAAERI